MVIISWNVNGLTACMGKNGFEPIQALQPDIVCLQEVKTSRRPKVLPEYHHYWETGQREGYAGVLTMAKHEPLDVRMGLGNESLDREGRIITLEYQSFYLINAYSPNSQENPERRDFRARWDGALFGYVQGLREIKPVIICGDFNVTRNAIDVFPNNTRIQEQEKGYISPERDSLEALLDSGFVDAFRRLHPDQEGAYTWWSARFDKRSVNDGWRLDYFLVDRQLAKRIHAVTHHTEIFGSDHCPIELKIHLNYAVGERFDRSMLRSMRPSIDFPDWYLGEMWEETDWQEAERILADLQKKLALAAYQHDDERIKSLQMQLVRRTEIKQLAVRKVCGGDSGPGVDGIRWKEPWDKMRAALMLTSKGYRAQPMRDIIVKSKSTGRERTYGLPTYFDRAMQVLYSFSLAPVLEAWGERKSFAFRVGRSALDANAYILEALQGKYAPELVDIIDVKAYYSNIQQNWLMDNTPMDKKVLGEFLRAGHVFAGELFPEEEIGISLGANLSPIMANHVLDGLQGYIYKHLNNGGPVTDYANGNLVRFADDIFITVRTKEAAGDVLNITRHFLAERGLEISEEKSKIVSVRQGFDFISRHYIKENGHIHVTPSRAAVDRIKASLQELISTHNRSQKNLIDSINRKLSGWASYQRYSDARAAFREIDEWVDKCLWTAALEHHPKMNPPKIRSKYWYTDSHGHGAYSLPDNRSVRVRRLSDVPIVASYEKILLNKNPYIDTDYFQRRHERKEIVSATGRYQEVWKRQQGRCYFCGRPILPDQARDVVWINADGPSLPSNFAYVHDLCKTNELAVHEVLGDVSIFTHRELLDEEPEIVTALGPQARAQFPGPLRENWRFLPLKKWFAKRSSASITLTFKEIEDILGRKLSPSTRKHSSRWYTRPDQNAMAEAWLTEGYKLAKLNLERERVTFHRAREGTSHVKLPEWLTAGKIPDGAKAEIEDFLKYIKKKYGI